MASLPSRKRGRPRIYNDNWQRIGPGPGPSKAGQAISNSNSTTNQFLSSSHRPSWMSGPVSLYGPPTSRPVRTQTSSHNLTSHSTELDIASNIPYAAALGATYGRLPAEGSGMASTRPDASLAESHTRLGFSQPTALAATRTGPEGESSGALRSEKDGPMANTSSRRSPLRSSVIEEQPTNFVDILSNQDAESRVPVLPSPAPTEEAQESTMAQSRSVDSHSETAKLMELAARYGGVEALERLLQNGKSASNNPENTPRQEDAQIRGSIDQSSHEITGDQNGDHNSGQRRAQAPAPLSPASSTPNTTQPQSRSMNRATTAAPLPPAHTQNHTQIRTLSTDSMNSLIRSLAPPLDIKLSLRQLEVHLQNLADQGREGSCESSRTRMLQQAFEEDDVFYLALHQLFCLQHLLPRAEPARAGLWLQPLTLIAMEKLIAPNKDMEPTSLKFWSTFPADYNFLCNHSKPYRDIILGVPPSMIMLAQRLELFKESLKPSQSAPNVSMIIHQLSVTSPVLQRIIFKLTIRCTWQFSLEPCGCIVSADNLFRENQMREFSWRQSGLRPGPEVAEYYHALLKRFHDIYTRHHAHLAPRQPPNTRMIQRTPSNNAYWNQPNNQQAWQLNQQSGSVAQNRQSSTTSRSVGTSAHAPQPYQNASSRYGHSTVQKPFLQQPTTVPSNATLSQVQDVINTAPGTTNSVIQVNFTGQQQPTSIKPNARLPQTNQTQTPLPQGSSLITNSGANSPEQPILLWAPAERERDPIPHMPVHPSFTLHQAHLRDDIVVPLNPGKMPPKTSKLNWFSYLKELALEPLLLKDEMVHVDGTFIVPDEDHCKIPPNKPAAFGAPSTRLVVPGSLSLRIKCIKTSQNWVAETTWAVTDTTWPNKISVELNNVPLGIRRKQHHGRDLPIDITHQVKLGINSIKVSVMMDKKELSTNSKYHLAVEKIEYNNRASIISTALAAHPINTGMRIRSELNSAADDDVEIVTRDRTVGVVDPFTSVQCITPVRTISCTHFECFDLEVYLDTRTGDPCKPELFKCPLCGLDGRPNQLVKDEWMVGILESLEELGRTDARAIVVNEQAAWSIKEEDIEGESGDGTGTRTSSNGVERSSRGPVEIIELD